MTNLRTGYRKTNNLSADFLKVSLTKSENMVSYKYERQGKQGRGAKMQKQKQGVTVVVTSSSSLQELLCPLPFSYCCARFILEDKDSGKSAEREWLYSNSK